MSCGYRFEFARPEDKNANRSLPCGLSGIASCVSTVQTIRARQLLEQRLSSYQRNPDFFDTSCDGVMAVQRVEAHLRQLKQLAMEDSLTPQDRANTTPSNSPVNSTNDGSEAAKEGSEING